MKLSRNLFILLILCCALTACHHNPLDIDVSNVKVPPVKIERMERDIFAMPPDSINSYTKKNGEKTLMESFYTDYVINFLNNGGIMDSTYAAGLRRFIADKDMRGHIRYLRKNSIRMLSFWKSGLTGSFQAFSFLLS